MWCSGWAAGLAICVAAPAAASWGTHGMVAADHRLASQAGVDILQHGGNAVDAAVATALAVCVVNPASCGIGGGGFMLIYLAQPHRAVALDYRETAPAAATRDMFLRNGQAVPELSRRGGLAVAVPGEVAGLTEAHRRYGTLPLATVTQPAIALARDGFSIEPHLAEEIAQNSDALRDDPGLARIFLHADGTPLRQGETLQQPELARTLERVAAEGASAFYRGSIAAAIAHAVDSADGILTAADLAAYRPRWRRPLQGEHHGYTVFTMPPPSSGGGVLLEVLDILRQDQLDVLAACGTWQDEARPDPCRPQASPTYDHLLAEAMQHAFADRAQYYGDPDMVRVPVRWLLSPANTTALRRRISATRTFDRSVYGSGASQALLGNDQGTSHLSVVDSAGNTVAVTTTINTAFGAKLVAGDTGIILNNEMDDFSAQPGVPNVYGLIGTEANAVAAGKRPLSSMTPTIVTRDRKVVLTLGGSGGPWIISGTLEVLLNVLDHGMEAASAVAAPRIHHQWMPPTLMVEPGVPEITRQALARYGHTVKEVPTMGAIQAVRVHGERLEGASDPRKGGEAVGW